MRPRGDIGRLWYGEPKAISMQNTLQPVTSRCDSCLRYSRQCDPNARARGRIQGVVIQLLVAPCSRIRCFKRNLTEQRLRRAPRCGEAVVEIVLIHNTGWVSPRLIPSSPQSLLSKPVFNIPT